jgi:cysteine-rich repeat protein
MSVRVLRPSGGLGRAARVAASVATLLAGSGALAATPENEQIALAGAAAVKIAVRGQGWVHVGQPALVAAGLDAGVDPARLQLFADGVERAVVVTGNGDASFTADEALEFYGTGRDTQWTDVRTYWLVVGAAGAAGARVPVQTPAAGGAAPPSFTEAARLVERTVYVSAIRNGDETNFFGGAVSSTPVTKTLTVHHLDAGAAAPVLRVSLQGVTATAHAIDVSVNGAPVGVASLADQAEGTFSFSTAANVVEGDNHVTLVGEGTSSDFTAIEGFELDYGHTYAADGDTLTFTAPAATRVTVTGFSAPGVRVVDVTDEIHPVELAVTLTAAAGANDARVDVPAGAGPHTLYAFTPAQVLAPAAVVADAPSTWTASHDGDLVIISHASFLGALAPLVARRAHDGWAVQLVDVQDVYDEFGFGDKTPEALRDFLATARATWRVPPRFVLLVGDATFDPRNFLGQGDFDFVPTKLIDTATMETSSDDWFVDADLDGVPELAIGRMPVRTVAQASAVVGKTLAYAGTADLPRGGLFVSDADEPDLDFSDATAAGEAKVSGIMPIDQFVRGGAGDTPDVLLSKLDAGPFLVNYMGHGSVEVWDDLLTSDQASALTNAHPSVYVIMNCLNGLFHDLFTTSLAESLLEAPNGGAVAVWASSTLSEFAPQPAYNQEFLMNLGRTSLGQSAIAAKQAITDLDSRRTWMLFGDPTIFGTPIEAADAGADGGADASTLDAGTDVSLGADADAGPDAPSEPGDATDAAAVSDAGVAGDADAAAGGDAAADGADATSDAKTTAASSGCACDVNGATPSTPAALGVLLAGAFVVARRAQARKRRRRRPTPTWPGPLALLILVVALAWAPQAQAAFGYRRIITIDRTRIGIATGATTLTNYPLLLDITDATLATTGHGGHVQNANGYDIVFVGTDATTCATTAPCSLSYDVESYDATAGHIVAWVRIPTLRTTANTSNTTITVEYGDATISSPAVTASGTWDSSFKAVWHLDQNPGGTAPQMTDATTTGDNATSNGAPAPATATGQISSGVSTSSTTGTGYFDYRSTTFNWSSSDTFTYSGWFNTTDSYGPLISQRDHGAGNPVIDIMVGYDGNTTSPGSLLTLVRDDTGVSFARITGPTVNDGTWHTFVLTRSGTTIQLYLDGTSVNSASDPGVASSFTTGAVGDYQQIGQEGNWVQTAYSAADQRYLAASFDEYRISNTVRSADWIKTDYNTQGTPASTFTLGGETLGSCGDGMVIAGESCDDGNIVSGDGCSSTCTVETGYTCMGTAPSVCTATCGDGNVAGSEACDDGNHTNGDGCSSTCTVESGYACTGSPSVCRVPMFNYLKSITIDRTKVGTASAPATLTNYPFLFDITDTSLRTIGNGGRVSSSFGYDIVFRGLDAATCGGPSNCTFPHEVESYNGTTGTLVAWVELPALRTQTNTANTSFQILFGNPSITTATQRITSTWDSSFTGVWHLNQTPSGLGSLTDSTSNGNHGTPTNVSTATGEVGPGVSTDGLTSFVSFGSGSSLNVATSSAFSYSAWFNTIDTLGGILSLRRASSGNPVVDIMVGYDGSTSSSASLLALARDDTGALGDINGGVVNDGAWHFLTMTRSGTTLLLYLDGVPKGMMASDTGASITSDIRNLGREGYWSTVTPMTFSTDQKYLAATLDEVRASSTARSAEWIITDYNNQKSPTSFITYTTGTGGEVTTNASTDVALLSIDATTTCAGTTLAWQTAYEVDTLGFNVYREVGGQRVQLNPDLIPGSGISGGGSHAYALVDEGTPVAGRTYWLETINFALENSWAGPVAPSPSPACAFGGAAVSDGRPAPTPVVASASAAPPTSNGDALAPVGGCTLAPGRGTDGAVAVAALAVLTLARRRRRRAAR